MPFDFNNRPWPAGDETFFHNTVPLPLLQIGPHCVSTVLGSITGERPESLQGIINAQDPITWSSALQKWGMKLAYCPIDVRKLMHYMTELVALDDLFALSYYSTLDKNKILGEPNENGWVCSSHIVIMHRSEIIDPAKGTSVHAFEHECNEYHTKRIFRVVPESYHRSI